MKTFLTALVLLISFNMSAQFDVNSGEKTEQEIIIEGQTHVVYMTANKSPYIICNSPRTNNNYAVWIGEETDKVIDGKPVRQSKSGKEFIFVVSPKSKNPYCKYLKKKQEEIIGEKIVAKTKTV